MRNSLCSWIISVAGLLGFARFAVAESVDFSRDVRPVLSRNCFACHGQDENTRKADLRLDIREGALAERKGSPAVVPGDRAGSELFARITTDDIDDIMPPEDSGHELTADEIERIGEWIDGGALYDRHWAFTPPTRPMLPRLSDRSWARNGIDHFILSGLEATGDR
jgi:hypothetical protein